MPCAVSKVMLARLLANEVTPSVEEVGKPKRPSGRTPMVLLVMNVFFVKSINDAETSDR